MSYMSEVVISFLMCFSRFRHCIGPTLACLSTRSATGDLLLRRGRVSAASTASLRRVSLLGPDSLVKSIRCSGSGCIFFENNCGGFRGGSSMGNPRLHLFPGGRFSRGRLLSSVEGSGCGVVVVLEDGGAGSLLDRAPVSVEEEYCVPFPPNSSSCKGFS